MKSMSEKPWLLFSCVLIFIMLFVGIYGLIVRLFFGEWESSGTFGDTFGALNAIFSGAALAGLVTTIFIQRRQIADQKYENEQQGLVNALNIAKDRYEFLMKQFLIINEKKMPKHFWEEVEKILYKELLDVPIDEVDNEDNKTRLVLDPEKFVDEIYMNWGHRYDSFLQLVRYTINFIENEYTSNPLLSNNRESETIFLVRMIFDQVDIDNLLLLAVHARGMESTDIEAYIDKYQLMQNVNTNTVMNNLKLYKWLRESSGFHTASDVYDVAG